MNFEDPKTEILNSDDSKVAQLLGGLKRVEAPGDFEFRVKARIASAKNGAGTVRLIPAFVRYAAPLMLVIVVVAVFLLNSSTSPSDGGPETAVLPSAGVQSREGQSVAVPSEIPSSSNQNSVPTVLVAGQNVKTGQKTPRSIPDRTPVKKVRAGDGSLDIALTPPKIRYPRGIEPVNLQEKRTPGVEATASLSISEVFSILGLDGDFGVSGWTVRSVRANSPAEGSGIKDGDIVESIDGNAVAAGTKFSGAFNGKAVRVLRGGERVNINIRNK